MAPHDAIGDQRRNAAPDHMRAQRISPKMPASVMPIASTTAMQPCGMSSMAARVEIGEALGGRGGEVLARRHEAQREGTPDKTALVRLAAACEPRIHTERRPFFSRIGGEGGCRQRPPEPSTPVFGSRAGQFRWTLVGLRFGQMLWIRPPSMRMMEPVM